MTSLLGDIVSDPTSFAIRELTGEQNDLVLEGRALPYQPFTLDGTMRAEVTWYPGNPIGALQMLGAEESPTTISGMWKDRYIRTVSIGGVGVGGGEAKAEYNGQRIGDAMSLCRVVEGFRLRGQLIEVTWDEIIRQGYLRRFRQSWIRREDVEWEMEFQWIARGEPITPVAFGPSLNIADVFNQISDAVDAVRTAIEAPFALVASIQNQLDTAIGIMDEALQAIEDIVNKAIETVLSPLESAKMILASVQTIKSQAKEISDTLESVPARALRSAAEVTAAVGITTSDQEGASAAAAQQSEETGEEVFVGTGGAGGIAGASGTEVAQTVRVAAARAEAEEEASQGIDGITHEQALEAERYKRNVRKASRNLKGLTSQREQELAAQSTFVQDVKTYIVRDTQDLRDISLAFYGSAEEWKRLLVYNNLTGSRLSAGQIILIPPLQSAESA